MIPPVEGHKVPWRDKLSPASPVSAKQTNARSRTRFYYCPKSHISCYMIPRVVKVLFVSGKVNKTQMVITRTHVSC